jgi:hypothetical protein
VKELEPWIIETFVGEVTNRGSQEQAKCLEAPTGDSILVSERARLRLVVDTEEEVVAVVGEVDWTRAAEGSS